MTSPRLIPAQHNPMVTLRIPEWERRALDPHYYPDRPSDCHDLIDRLRAQELTTEPDQSDRHGMASQ